jgi:CrcB protein
MHSCGQGRTTGAPIISYQINVLLCGETIRFLFMLKNILIVGLGGFIGSVARYFMSMLNLNYDILSIPVGTLSVNILGSLIIGFLTGISEKSDILSMEWRLFLMVGICGGFTTFSSFTNENLVLMHNGQYFSVFLYTGLSIFLGFAAVYLGYIITNSL